MTINAASLLAFDSGEIEVPCDERACILYALSIGIGMEPCDPESLAYVYEKNLRAFPAMVSVLGWPGRMTDPAYGIDHRKVVASELDVEWFKPLRVGQRLVSRARVANVYDKGPGKAAVIGMERTLSDAAGERVALVRNSVLALGQGGFGGTPGDEMAPPHTVPDSPPDLTCDLKTPPNLALLFRLHGDTNPIHIDPALAARAGFEAPLLHGAANFGIAAHALARSVAGHDASRFSRMQARFAKPFFPGETLRTEMWVDGEAVSFRCRSLERGEVILSNGLFHMHATSQAL